MKNLLELKYGIIIGLLVCGWIMLEFALGFHGERLHIGRYSGYFAAIFPIVGLWLAIKKRRDRDYGGTIKISQGLKTSFYISIVAGLILAIFMFAYVEFINPGFAELSVKQQVDQLRSEGYSEEELLQVATSTLALLSGPIQAGIAFVGSVFQGVIIGFVITLILRRKKKYATPVPGGQNPQPPANPPQSGI